MVIYIGIGLGALFLGWLIGYWFANMKKAEAAKIVTDKPTQPAQTTTPQIA